MTNETEIRCPFRMVLVGVSFWCQGKFGHHGRCWNAPEGCGGDATLAWVPSQEERSAELLKVLSSGSGKR